MTHTEAGVKSGTGIWTVVAFLLLAILLTASYKLKDLLKPGITTTVAFDESCDLRKGKCSTELPGGGQVSFSIMPDSLPILRPLTLDVELDGIAASEVEVDFIGIGMEMGYNRPLLSAVDKNHFAGDTVLPVCVRSKMDWEARVLLHTEQGVVMVPFRFYTLK